MTNNDSLVREHINRCIECYGMDVETKTRKVDRDTYEGMRADLMLAIGMLMAMLGQQEAAADPGLRVKMDDWRNPRG